MYRHKMVFVVSLVVSFWLASIVPATAVPVLSEVFTDSSDASTLADPLRVRRNEKDLDGAGQQLFVDAIKAMKAAPAKGDGTMATNRYDEFVLAHSTAQAEAHDTSAFLPWHRKLLWEFETEVRQLAPKFANFTIPYWDWTKDPFPSFLGPNGTPPSFTVTDGPFKAGQWKTLETGPDNGTNDLNRHFNDIGKLMTDGPGGVTMALAQTTFTDFTFLAEAGTGLHNDAHVRVGGHLSRVSSGIDDPVFWMLHDYVDLLWLRWELGKGSLSSYEVSGGGPELTDNLANFGDPASKIGFMNTVNNKVADQLNPFDTAKLGYTYEFSGQVLAIPEPCSLALFGSGTIVLIGFALKKRARGKRLGRVAKAPLVPDSHEGRIQFACLFG